MTDVRLLKEEERAILALRELYRSHGYLSYKMSKFEEYDLYVQNKDFLVSDRIIAFSDTNGKLMALKPDVTLSIIKNGEDVPGIKQKVYYNENVYRVSESTHQYKEIMQTGVECVGEIDLYDLYETVSMAASSLSLISDCFVLDVSHLGLLKALLDEIGAGEDFRRRIAECVASKNRHDIARICREAGVERAAEKLCAFVDIYGDMQTVLRELEPLCTATDARAAFEELRALAKLLEKSPHASKIRFDFSIVNDLSYYNGIVFKGYLGGVCESVLSGGQYDKLLRRMGRRSGAIGFAIYLDLLQGLSREHEEYDVDVLVIADRNADPMALAEYVAELRQGGKCVTVQREIPSKLRYRERVDFGKGERV
jgi:ATP phosphoribosyltransferase regulatory subunit